MMNLKETLLQIGENMRWEEPRSVGTARVDCVVHPWHDMVYLQLGQKEELTAKTATTTPVGVFKQGDIVEVIVRQARFQSLRDHNLGLPRICRVAIRPFNRQTVGKLTAEDLKKLAPMFQDISNRIDPIWDRAFYRRFLGVNLRPIIAEDIQGPGQNL